MITARKVNILLALTLGYLAAFGSIGRSQPTREYKTFAQWCENLPKLSAPEKYTVEALLKKAGTRKCSAADKILSGLTELKYLGSQVSDLKPLSSLKGRRN
jgi:internalin A